MNRYEIHITSDPEDYIESCPVHEVNAGKQHVGYDSYIVQDDVEEDVHIKLTNQDYGDEKANQKGDKVHWKSNSLYGEDGACHGRLITTYIYIED